MSAWLPIETVSKDGTLIDVWVSTRYEGIPTGGYRIADAVWASGGWCYRERGVALFLVDGTITHWMPIPDGPPESKMPPGF